MTERLSVNQGMRERLLKVLEEMEAQHPEGRAPGGHCGEFDCEDYHASDGHFCDGFECDWSYGVRRLIPLTKQDIAYAVRLALTQLSDGSRAEEASK